MLGKKKIIISVNITCYNSEKKLGKILKSLELQNLHNKNNVEINFCDDGSIDQTLKVLNSFKNKSYKNVKIIKHESNKGVAQARNNLIDISSGEWVTFFDSDDFISDNFLKEIINFKNESKVNCIFPKLLCKNKISTKEHYSIKNLIAGEVFSMNESPEKFKMHSSSTIFKLKDIIKHNLRFQNIEPAFEDTYFLNQFLALEKSLVKYNDKIIYTYTTDSNSSLSLNGLKNKKMVTFLLPFLYNNLKSEKRKFIRNTIIMCFSWVCEKMSTVINLFPELETNAIYLRNKINKCIDFTEVSALGLEKKNFFLAQYKFSKIQKIEKKDFRNDFYGLLELEKEFQHIEINNYNIWFTLKTFLNGKIHGKYSNSSRTTNNIRIIENEYLRSQQLSEATNTDIILFNFGRKSFSNNEIIDPLTIEFKLLLEKENANFIEVETPSIGIISDFIGKKYQILDLYYGIINNPYKYIENGIDNDKIKYLEHRIMEVLSFKIDVFASLNDQINNSRHSYDYYTMCFKKMNPRCIVAPASYTYNFVTAAKDLGIPVIDIQYAIFTKYHVGYHMSIDYRFCPDQILLWGKYWDKKKNFGKINSDNLILGHHKLKDIECSKTNSVVFISQNLIGDFIENEAVSFAKKFTQYQVVLAKHPLESVNNKYENIKNFKITKGNLLENISSAEAVIGVASTGLFHALYFSCKVIILNNYLNCIVEEEIENEIFSYTDNLNRDFKEIMQKGRTEIANEMFAENSEYELLSKLKNSAVNNKMDSKSKEIYDYYKNINGGNIINFRDYFLFEEEILLSVIIPCFNSENTIERAIKSFISSFYINQIEIIVIDDASEDNTVKIIEKLIVRQKNIKLIKNRVNSGTPSNGRNEGINTSKGKYIYFFDSDDYLFGNTFDLCLSLLLNGNYDVLRAGIVVDFGDEVKFWKGKKQKIENIKTIGKIIGLYFNPAHFFKRKLIIENKLHYVDKKTGEDLLFILSYYKLCKNFIEIDMPLYVYDKRTMNSLSKKYSKNTFLDAVYIYRECFNLLSSREFIYFKQFYGIKNLSSFSFKNAKFSKEENILLKEVFNNYDFDLLNSDVMNDRLYNFSNKAQNEILFVRCIFEEEFCYITVKCHIDDVIYTGSVEYYVTELLKGYNIIKVPLLLCNQKIQFFCNNTILKITKFPTKIYKNFNREFSLKYFGDCMTMTYSISKTPYFKVGLLCKDEKIYQSVEFLGKESYLKIFNFHVKGKKVEKMSVLYEINSSLVNSYNVVKSNNFILQPSFCYRKSNYQNEEIFLLNGYIRKKNYSNSTDFQKQKIQTIVLLSNEKILIKSTKEKEEFLLIKNDCLFENEFNTCFNYYEYSEILEYNNNNYNIKVDNHICKIVKIIDQNQFSFSFSFNFPHLSIKLNCKDECSVKINGIFESNGALLNPYDSKYFIEATDDQKLIFSENEKFIFNGNVFKLQYKKKELYCEIIKCSPKMLPLGQFLLSKCGVFCTLSFLSEKGTEVFINYDNTIYRNYVVLKFSFNEQRIHITDTSNNLINFDISTERTIEIDGETYILSNGKNKYELYFRRNHGKK